VRLVAAVRELEAGDGDYEERREDAQRDGAADDPPSPIDESPTRYPVRVRSCRECCFGSHVLVGRCYFRTAGGQRLSLG
jgi:hypothetical protein